MSKNKETVILTGAAGFVGINMTKVLIEEGYNVIGLDINDNGLNIIKECGAEVKKCDMLKEDLVSIFREGDYLIHIAGLFKFNAPAKQLFLINADLTKIVMEAATKVNFKHIIHFSTVGTYGTPAKNRNTSPVYDYEPYKETDPQKPDNTYGISKYKGELIAWKYFHKYNLPLSIVRPSLIYGPNNRYGMAFFFQLGSYCRNLFKGPAKHLLLFPLALLFRGGTRAHFVHVEDLCRACALILRKEETIGEAYNIGDAHPISTIELFNLMLRPFRIKMPWRFVPLSRLLIKNYNKIFNDVVTKILEKVLTFCFKIYGWYMNYNPKEIPLEISKDWIGYFQSNYIWSIKKLQELGFKHKYPKLKKGILENAIWYKKNKWIP
ncbi:MAG: NAD-dependent epimerase/dehydratase family protein [Promethearchaeota archaeon]